MNELAAKHDFIKFYPSVSRPNEERNANWTGAKGRINLLVEDYLEKLGIDPKETCVYACGHPQMIEDVGVRMESTDYNFIEERFWKEDE